MSHCLLGTWLVWPHWACPPPPYHSHPTCHWAHPHVSGRRGGRQNQKLSTLSVYRLYHVGRFLSTWRCRVQREGNNTFEYSAEWATIAAECKQCGPGAVNGHGTQLPRLQPQPWLGILGLYLWHTLNSQRSTRTLWKYFKHFLSSHWFSLQALDVLLTVKFWTQPGQDTLRKLVPINHQIEIQQLKLKKRIRLENKTVGSKQAVLNEKGSV